MIKPWSVFVATLVVVLVCALALGLWQAREALLLAFGALILATLLRAITRPIERWSGMGRRWSLGLAGLALLAIAAGFSAAVGSQLGSQLDELQRRLPSSLEDAERRAREALGLPKPSPAPQSEGPKHDRPGGAPWSAMGPGAQALDIRSILTGAVGSIASFGSMLLSSLASLLIVIVGGFYLAADPSTYRRGVVALFPHDRKPIIEDALISVSASLNQWLLAQLISMALVGALIGLGAWLLDLPAPLALGLFAGLTEFIPVIGPYLGAAPALVIAAGSGTDILLWTAGLFLLVQQIESNLITPIVQQRMTDVPAFLVLYAIVALGLIFGFIGVLIAAPLTVVLHTLVRKLYIEAALIDGDR